MGFGRKRIEAGDEGIFAENADVWIIAGVAYADSEICKRYLAVLLESCFN